MEEEEMGRPCGT